MNRRNFSFALITLVVAAVALVHEGLRQVGSLMAWGQRRAKLNERQKLIEAADQDLMAIVEAEISYIEEKGKFAKLDELISSRDLGPEMAGRHGYVYSVRLEGNGITASAYPAPGEQLPAVLNESFGPGLASVLARLI